MGQGREKNTDGGEDDIFGQSLGSADDSLSLGSFQPSGGGDSSSSNSNGRGDGGGNCLPTTKRLCIPPSKRHLTRASAAAIKPVTRSRAAASRSNKR